MCPIPLLGTPIPLRHRLTGHRLATLLPPPTGPLRAPASPSPLATYAPSPTDWAPPPTFPTSPNSPPTSPNSPNCFVKLGEAQSPLLHRLTGGLPQLPQLFLLSKGYRRKNKRRGGRRKRVSAYIEAAQSWGSWGKGLITHWQRAVYVTPNSHPPVGGSWGTWGWCRGDWATRPPTAPMGPRGEGRPLPA